MAENKDNGLESIGKGLKALGAEGLAKINKALEKTTAVTVGFAIAAMMVIPGYGQMVKHGILPHPLARASAGQAPQAPGKAAPRIKAAGPRR